MNEHRRSKVVANRSYCTVPTSTVLYCTVFNNFLYSIVPYACSHALTAARDSLHYSTSRSNKAKILQYKHSDKLQLPLTAIILDHCTFLFYHLN